MLYRGFTLLELLVAIAVVSVLCAIGAPAIERAREATRRMECESHLRQLALACHSFHDTHGHLPADSSPRWVIGRSFPNMLSTWSQVLPYVDQAQLYAEIDMKETGVGVDNQPPASRENAHLLRQSVRLFQCGSDRQPRGSVSYRMCRGTLPGNAGGGNQQGVGRPGAAFSTGSRSRARFNQIIDGLSNTTLCSERLVGDYDSTALMPTRDVLLIRFGSTDNPDDFVAACISRNFSSQSHASYTGATWLFAGYANTWYNHLLTPNSAIPDCSNGGLLLPQAAMTARSWHLGGVNAATADGAVRFVSENIDLSVWRALGTRAGQEVVTP